MQKSKKESERFGELADMETGGKRGQRIVDGGDYAFRCKPKRTIPKTRWELQKELHAIGKKRLQMEHKDLSVSLGESMKTAPLDDLRQLIDDIGHNTRPYLAGEMENAIEKILSEPETVADLLLCGASIPWEWLERNVDTSEFVVLHEMYLARMFELSEEGAGNASF